MPYAVLATKHFPPELREQLAPILANGDFHHGDNFEQMAAKSNVGKIFSIRLNQKSRVMVARLVVQGQPTWLLLELLEHHEYQDAQSLKKGWLANYLNNHGASLENEVREILETAETEHETEVKEIEYHNDHWLVLTEDQKPRHINYPLIFEGMPGSGKSVTALAMARTEVGGNDNREVIYVTKSPELANHMRMNVEALPGETIQVLDYPSLMRKLGRPNFDLQEDHLANCLAWLKKNSLDLEYNKLGFKQADELHQMLYREFRIISGCASAEAYFNLGRRQALFAEDTRQTIYKAYTNYIKSEKGSRDTSLVRANPPFEAIFKAVFVDESQDFTDAELLDLLNLCNGRIIFFMDSNQSLIDVHSKKEALKRHLGRDVSTVVLPCSFRCSQAVVKVANAFLQAKLQAMGGALEKNAATQIKTDDQAEVGQAVWVEHQAKNTTPSKAMEDLQAASTKRIIVTWPEYFAEAKKLFPNAIVLSPEQVKGLEYDELIAYRLLDEAHFANVNALLSDDSIELGEKASRAKAEYDRRELGPDLNQVFTAFTRARKNLYVIDDSSSHKTKKLTQCIKQTCSDEQIKTTLAASTTEEWRQQVEHYIKEKRFGLAQQISDKHLGPGVYESLLPSGSTSSACSITSSSPEATQEKSHRKVAKAAKTKASSVTIPVKTSTSNTFFATPKVSSATKSKSTVADLHAACKKGVSAIRRLVENGADFRQNVGGRLPLHTALELNQIEIVKYLFSLDPSLDYKLNGSHPIHTAAIAGNLELLRFFHRKGVDLNLDTGGGSNAASFAIQGDWVHVLEYCHTNGMDLNKSFTNGFSPLCKAILSRANKCYRYLLQAGVDINQVASNGGWPLLTAVMIQDEALIQELHNKGANLHKLVEEGRSLHFIAAEKRAPRIIMLLHALGLDVNLKSSIGKSPLVTSIELGYENVTECLLKLGAAVNVKGWPPVHAAIRKNNLKLLQVLKDKGADLNALDINGKSTLEVGIESGRVEIVDWLLAQGLQVNQPMKRQSTLLSTSIRLKRPPITRSLVLRGADIDGNNVPGASALLAAVECGDYDLVKFLVKRGANVNAVNQKKQSVLDLAIQLNHGQIATHLLEQGADFEVVDANCNTPLHQAVECADEDMVSELYQKGANLNHPNNEGVTPAMKAAQIGDYYVLEYLFKSGANMNTTNRYGAAPVHLANNIPCLKELKKAGADFNAMTNSGLTPLLSAVSLGNLDWVIVLVEECGADPHLANKNGVTPLALATRLERTDIINYLATLPINQAQASTSLVPRVC